MTREDQDRRPTLLVRVLKWRVLRRLLGRRFLLANEWIWSRLPSSLVSALPVRTYGAFLHFLVRLRSDRRQYHGTYFLRNRPELELIRRLSNQKAKGSTLSLAVLACSNGAEVYSILWAIRSARPDLKVIVRAIDIANDILEVARNGRYSLQNTELMDTPIFERMTDKERQAMFDNKGDHLQIKSSLREGIDWRVGDAADPGLLKLIGGQDIVVANRFLCHMDPPDAERCLRNLADLVNPGGYLFVSGVDLEIRSKVARDCGWIPVRDLLQEIHGGDSSLRAGWPWKYWGLEPIDAKRADWTVRYASVFRVGHHTADSHFVPIAAGGVASVV